MADWPLVPLAVLGAGVLVYLLVLARRKTLAGDMDTPMDLERHRARSVAEVAAAETDVLSDAEAADVAEFAGFTEKIRSDEYPIVHKVRRRYVRRDLGRRLAVQERHRKAYSAAWSKFLEADPLTAPLPVVHKPAPVLSSMPALEPAWELESFTAGWTRAGRTVTRLTVKRACNGCGTLLGDLTEAEMDAAMVGAPAPDVRGECPTCTPLSVDAAAPEAHRAETP